MNKDKSLGQDGITSEFYQRFWPRLVPILVEVYTNIFYTGQLADTMKNGLITLIYKKKGDPNDLKYWRPITLLTADYKILSKMLTSRLNNYINELLNPFQSSGSKERDILNNILNLQTILEYVKENNEDLAVISLDNEKAFDRIEQNFINKVLVKYGFHTNFLRWFSILYSNITSQVIVNGKLTPKFNIERSVRQGCPLSMLLFVLSLEPLISRINNNNFIKGIKIPNIKEQIKSLQHADDLTALVTTDRSYQELKCENEAYSKVSGSKINDQKTEILKKGNFETLEKEYIKEDIKVLGCMYGNINNLNYKLKIDKLKQKVENWNFVRLNICDKVIAIKTYFIGLFQYQMRAFKMSRHFYEKYKFDTFYLFVEFKSRKNWKENLNARKT